MALALALWVKNNMAPNHSYMGQKWGHVPQAENDQDVKGDSSHERPSDGNFLFSPW